MAWKEMFDEKFMTAEEAAKMINSGRCCMGGGPDIRCTTGC